MAQESKGYIYVPNTALVKIELTLIKELTTNAVMGNEDLAH